MINLSILYIVKYSNCVDYYLKILNVDNIENLEEFSYGNEVISQNICSIKSKLLFEHDNADDDLEELLVSDYDVDKVVHVSRERLKSPEQSV